MKDGTTEGKLLSVSGRLSNVWGMEVQGLGVS